MCMGKTMLAAVLDDVREMPVREVPKPEPQEGEALIRVMACGICMTDYSAYLGRRRDWDKGSIQGHEFAGIIEGLGRRAASTIDWKEGDEVVVSPVVHCGKCRNCRLNMQHYCENGEVIGGEGQPVKRDGALAEYVRVPVQALYRKPKNVTWEMAAETEPLAGSYKGMIEYSQLRVPEDVVILGVGSMGLLLTQVAASGGAGRLIASDPSEFRRKKALEMGATHAIDPENEDVIERVREILPKGPDIVFEAAGVIPVAKQAFDLCRRGTRLNMFGVIVPGTIEVSPADIHFLETRVDASFSVTPRVMEKALDLMERGKADPSKIVTHRFSLEEMDKALEAMESPERIKVMVTP
jgi:L-iditol 2-dehydrogenase